MKWRLNVNKSNSQVVHFRESRITQSNYKLKHGDSILDTISDYKYLGVILDENITLSKCSKSLSESGGKELFLNYTKQELFRYWTKVVEYGDIVEITIQKLYRINPLDNI